MLMEMDDHDDGGDDDDVEHDDDHEDDGEWRWHAEDLEYYATREPALSVHLPGTPEAPVSHRFKRWSGPSLTSWSTESTLESVNISKYSKGMVNGHLSNQLHHFSIVVIFADM